MHVQTKHTTKAQDIAVKADQTDSEAEAIAEAEAETETQANIEEINSVEADHTADQTVKDQNSEDIAKADHAVKANSENITNSTNTEIIAAKVDQNQSQDIIITKQDTKDIQPRKNILGQREKDI